MKRKTSSIKKNLAYQAFYEVLGIILPLITSPYVSRVLGAEGLGIYSYTYSIAYYFQLFGLLGIKFYGNRSIARVRDNQAETNKVFSEILIVHLFFSTISTICYLFYAIYCAEYSYYSLLQVFMVLAAFFDISWLFFGLEEFKSTVTRNSIIKIGTVALIFLLVHDRSDLPKYLIIMSSSQLVGNLLLWWMARKLVRFSVPKLRNLLRHIKPLFVLFIPVISLSLFKYMDKIMLGAIGNKVQLGYYENAEKILNIPLSVILSFGTVMLPKMSNLLASKANNRANRYIEMSFKYVMCLSFAMAFGMAAIAKNFAPIFWGNDFVSCSALIMMLSISLPFSTVANIVRNQDLIPNGKDKYYSIAIIVGAISNLIINWCLIPSLQAVGVTIGTIVSEILVCVVQLFMADREIHYMRYIRYSLIYIIPGFAMFSVVYYVGNILGASTLTLIIQVLIGAIVYGGLVLGYLLLTKDEELHKLLLRLHIK